MEIISIIEMFYKYDKKVALSHQHKEITYRELYDNILTVANGLKSLNINAGEYLAIKLDNSPDLIYCFFAGLLNDITLLPICEKQGSEEVERIFSQTKCENLIISKKSYDSLNKHSALLSKLKQVIILAEDHNENIAHALTSRHVLDSSRKHKLKTFSQAYNEKRPALIFYTSGSTGKPKGIVHPYSFIKKTCNFYQKNFLYNENDKIIISLTLGYAGASTVQMLPGLYSGATLILFEDFNASLILDAILTKHATNCSMTPTQVLDLLNVACKKKVAYNSLRLCLGAGNKLDVDAIIRFKTLFKTPISEAWGMTECGICFMNEGDDDKRGAMGKALPEITCDILDEKGNSVSNDTTGELIVKSPLLFSGYFDDQALNVETHINGYLRTGDLVSRDKDNFYWFQGRKKYVIICNGSNVSPEEVEIAIQKKCHIEKICIIGRRHPDMGESTVAFIEGKKDCITLEDMTEKLTGVLADYKIPTALHFLPAFPMTASGRIDKKALERIN